MLQPLDILREKYGYREFRDRQGEIIEHVVAGGDAFVLMPTGGGKSLCYQIPSLCRDGVGVVVSPLIALMQDQITQLAPSNTTYSSLVSFHSRRRLKGATKNQPTPSY